MDSNKENKIPYKQLIKSKKESYVIARRKERIALGKHNPKGFWKELQQKRKKIENNIIEVQWVEYVKLLYEWTNEKCRPPTIDTSAEFFSMINIKRYKEFDKL